MPPIAAIDIGTNSVKLTVADAGGGRLGGVIVDAARITRLGRGVDATGRLSEEAMSATLDTLREFAATARARGAARLGVVGTSALRDAQNGNGFRARAAEIVGAEIEIVAGEREAELTYKGALSDDALLPGASSETGVLAFDIGGGSTELIRGRGARIARSASLDLGAVRLTERALPSQSPTAAELSGARARALSALSAFPEATAVSELLIGIGGTVATLAALLAPERRDVQGARLTRVDCDGLVARLAAMSLAERKTMPGLDPARADVIVAGALIASAALERFGALACVVSTRGVRYGLLLEMARAGS